MKKRKIKIAIISIVSLLGLAGMSILIMHYILGMEIWPFEKKSDANEKVEIITETYPTEIIILGNSVGIPEEYHAHYISEISEENLTSNGGYKFSILVINDLDGTIQLSSSDWDIIEKFVSDKTNFYYLGNQYFDKIKTLGFYTDDLPDTDLSIVYLHEKKESFPMYGMWTKESNQLYEEKNSKLLSDVLIHSFIADVIKPNVK
ncbi:MAG: hypothetical protein Q4F05_07915 [bacterium]|nr:hypothetical protein [bacterium]